MKFKHRLQRRIAHSVCITAAFSFAVLALPSPLWAEQGYDVYYASSYGENVSDPGVVVYQPMAPNAGGQSNSVQYAYVQSGVPNGYSVYPGSGYPTAPAPRAPAPYVAPPDFSDLSVPQFAQSPVLLTFDDGPHPRVTPVLLKYLQAAGIRDTIFFFVGQRMRQYPDLVRQVAAAGYPIGYHSMDHRNLAQSNTAAVSQDIQKFKTLLNKILGYPYPLAVGRPPYGGSVSKGQASVRANEQTSAAWGKYRIAPSLSSAFKAHGLEMLLWDVDTKDWKRPLNPSLVDKRFKPGKRQIWLLHEFPKTRVTKALPSLLRRFQFLEQQQVIGARQQQANPNAG